MLLEQRFYEELLRILSEAEAVTGIHETKLPREAEQYGAAKAVAARIRRGRSTAQFDALRRAGRLDLTPEALVSRGKYAPLFDDETVNACLGTLLGAGYYG